MIHSIVPGPPMTEIFASSTDPAVNAAVSPAIVDAHTGVLITLTAAGNAQTLQDPTALTVKKFTVVNNDTSTHSIVVNGITLPPDKGQTFIWDGTAWGPASLGITAVPVPVPEGGTGRNTGSTAYGLIAAGTTATGVQQTLAVADITEMLVGGGASAVPVWTTATGSGAPVRAESPTLVTPTIGVASATSINKVTVTAPATGSTLTIADGKTAAINDNLTVTAGQAVTLAAEDAAGSITLDNTLFEIENTDATQRAVKITSAKAGDTTLTLQENLTVGDGFDVTLTAEDAAGTVTLDNTLFEIENTDATQRTVKITSAKAGDTTLTLQENLTVGDGFDVTLTSEDAAGTVTLDNATLEIENLNATQRDMKLSVGTDADAALTIEGTSGAIDQDLTSDASPTFTAVNAITFDTNVAAAGVTLAGTTLAADGTDSDINIAITPKGTGEVDITKVDIDGGTIDGTVIGENDASTIKTTTAKFTAPTVNPTEVGNLFWDADHETLSVNYANSVRLQIGEETFLPVKNGEGTTIVDGTPVYGDGESGERLLVYRAKADDWGKNNVVGVATHDIATNGRITRIGMVRAVPQTIIPGLETWVAGDQLYLSTTAGEMTNVRPTPPTPIVEIGTVLNLTGAATLDIMVSIKLANNALEDTTTPAYHTILASNSDGTTLTADRVLTFDLNNADRTLDLSENLTVGDGFDVTLTAEDAASTVTLDNATLEIENLNATQRDMKLSVGTDADAALTIEGTSGAIDQDLTSDASPTFTAVNAITFDTNVAAAGVTLAGTTLAADGTDADINIAITPKGTGEVDISNKIHVEGGVLRGAGGNYDQVSVNADFKGTNVDKETDIFFDSGAVGKDSAFRYVGGDGTGNWGRGYYHKYDKTNNQLAFGYNSAGNYKDASAVPQDNDHLVIKSDGSVSVSTVDIDGGAIDGTTVGSATPAAGAFTTLKQTTGAADGAIPISDAAGAFTLTASTGTGAPVRATSPTLVTPALGAATATSLTTDNLSFAVDINRYGFVNRAETTLAFDDVTYTLTLTDVGAGWSYYRAGIKYTITGNKTIVLTGTPPTPDTYYIYIDGTTGDLINGAVWTLNDTKVPVAVILWDNTLTPKYHLLDERHTSLIDRKIHEKWHSTVGTLLKALGTISGQTISGSTDAENTFGIGTSYIYDEDILHTLTAIADPDGATPTYNVFYRTAASTYAWEVSNVPFKYTGAGYIEYDNAGTMTAGTHSDFYNSYLVCTPFGFVMLPGRGEFTNLAAAQAENPQTFDFTGFPIAESVIVRQFTWEARSVLGTLGKCRLAAAPRVISISVTSAVVPAENVGTIAAQDADNVNISGGIITGTRNAGTTGGMQIKFVEEVSAALSGATGTITLNIPANSWIRGVQLRVDTLIETATGWDAAFSGGNTAAIGTGLAVAANTKVNSFSGGLVTGTTDITLTASGGNFSAGVVRAIAYYDTLVAMGDA